MHPTLSALIPAREELRETPDAARDDGRSDYSGDLVRGVTTVCMAGVERAIHMDAWWLQVQDGSPPPATYGRV